MSFSELATKRYSQRAYDPRRPVNRTLVNKVLETVRWAPSAHNNQPWHFVVVESPTARAAVCTAYPLEWLRAAPVIVAVKGNRSEAWHRTSDNYDSLETDLAIALDHLVLAATDLGLGTCWVADFDPQKLAKALALGPDETVFAFTPLGYGPGDPKQPAKSPRKPLTQVVTYL